MKLLYLGLILLCSYTLAAQETADTIPPYKKVNTIPQIDILKPDSTWFTNKQLTAERPLVIVYFSPDCGHCQQSAQDFARDMDKLKNVELLWVSYHTPEQIGEFAKTYKLDKFKNVVMGRDPNYRIPTFYRIEFTPFMAVYDKKGRFLEAYPRGTDPDTISQLLKTGK